MQLLRACKARLAQHRQRSSSTRRAPQDGAAGEAVAAQRDVRRRLAARRRSKAGAEWVATALLQVLRTPAIMQACIAAHEGRPLAQLSPDGAGGGHGVQAHRLLEHTVHVPAGRKGRGGAGAHLLGGRNRCQATARAHVVSQPPPDQPPQLRLDERSALTAGWKGRRTRGGGGRGPASPPPAAPPPSSLAPRGGTPRRRAPRRWSGRSSRSCGLARG